MTVYTYQILNELLQKGNVGICIAVPNSRIIIPTDCKEIVGFTNPDDLNPELLARWKKGERGIEFENQKLMPRDCLVLHNTTTDINKILDKNPNWYKSLNGIKKTIEKLYHYTETGGKNIEPAIWNSNLNWAKSVKLTTSEGISINKAIWEESVGKALKVTKLPIKQYFIHLQPGDELISPNGNIQTAGSMSAIAIRQPNKTWNMVQLSAKGYTAIE